MNKQIKDYFSIKELVCPDVYKRHGESAWHFFDPRLLDVLLWIRKYMSLPIYVNNWDMGGNLTQRGLRCNLCQLVADKTKKGTLYLSAHQMGQAVDFDVKGWSAEAVRQWLNSVQAELPHKIRLEKDVTWVHLDVREHNCPDNIYWFKG